MERLGRYDLGRVLGQGGAGMVFEAVLRGPGGLRKPVALKVLHSGSAALRREARIGGLLRHQNLVDVYEVGEADGRYFCALERCGTSLDAHLPMPPQAVVDVGLQVCAALQYAHQQLGLVHLDLKPANLLLGPDGAVKVGDLGIAVAEGFASDGRARGTRGYMSPEQIRGGEVDVRADLFALGVTLVELATGGRPGASGTLDLDSLEPDGPVGSGATTQRVPPWLEPAVGRCLAFAAEDRWGSPRELMAALRGLEVSGPGLRHFLQSRGAWPDGAETGGVGVEPGPIRGREGELEALATGLEVPGLITLKGPAGIGKTRLAAEAAMRWARAGRGIALRVDLAGARGQPDLVGAVGAALGLTLRSRAQGRKAVASALAGRGALVLLLDTFDHLVEQREVVADWVAAAPELRLLATCREPIRVAGERVVEVGPLGGPAARALLADRALQRGVDVTGDPALERLAELLDGVPLSLELAAGRLGVLSVHELVERLDLSLLRRGSGGRHSTLEAALDWSWGLLGRSERQDLARLSVCAGGFSLELAEAMLGDGAFERVGALVDRSMVHVRSGGRLGLLGGIRVHARARLEDPGRWEVRHGRALAQLGAPRALAALRAPGGVSRHRALELELDNLLVACRRAIAREDGAVAVGALCAAWQVLELRGPYDGALELAEQVVAVLGVGGGPAARARLVAGRAARMAGDPDRSQTHLEASLALAEHAGDRVTEGACLYHLGIHAVERGEPDLGAQMLHRSLACHVASGSVALEGQTRCGLAILAQRRGRLGEAEGIYGVALRLSREAGDRRLEATVVGNHAVMLHSQGRIDEALAAYRTTLGTHRDAGDLPAVVRALGNLGALEQELGQSDLAAERYGEAMAIARQLGDQRLEGFVAANLAAMNTDAGDLDAAGAHYERAVQLNRACSEPFFLCVALGGLGVNRFEQGEREAGRENVEEAITVARESGIPRLEGHFLAIRARLHGLDGEVNQALELLDRAEALLREGDDLPLLAEARTVRAELHLRAGDPVRAEALLHEAGEIAPDGDARSRRAIARVRALFKPE